MWQYVICWPVRKKQNLLRWPPGSNAKRTKNQSEENLFGKETPQFIKRKFSEESKAVFDAGRELWKYYHSKPFVNVNASFYDIREYFQGRNDKGRMNSKSDDEKYMELIGKLRNN